MRFSQKGADNEKGDRSRVTAAMMVTSGCATTPEMSEKDIDRKGKRTYHTIT
jgi:hypothetical protein